MVTKTRRKEQLRIRMEKWRREGEEMKCGEVETCY